MQFKKLIFLKNILKHKIRIRDLLNRLNSSCVEVEWSAYQKKGGGGKILLGMKGGEAIMMGAGERGPYFKFKTHDNLS